MPPVVAAIPALLPSLIGGAAAVYTGSEAVKSQKKAAKKALAQQESQTRVAREESETALRKLGEITKAGPGGPMYQFRKGEAESSLEAQMRAAGTWKSGRALEASRRISQQLTAEETEAHTGRLQSLASMSPGTTSTAPITAIGQAERLGQGVVGREISGLAGTWEAERRRKREEEERKLRSLESQQYTSYPNN